jgi:hypothetical protein
MITQAPAPVQPLGETHAEETSARFHPQDFTFIELLPGVVLCEAPAEDPHCWGNAHADEPAFLAYLGYNIPQERDEWIARLRLIWKIDREIVDRASQRVPGYWHEIKIRGMQRYSDPTVLVHMRQHELEATAYEEMATSRLLTSR